MNSPDPDAPLAPALATWRLSPPTDPNFRPSVWQRIKRNEGENWAAYLRAHRARWAIASALVIAASGWTGHTVAQAKLAAGRERMVVSYLVALDPRVLATLPHSTP